MNVERLKACLTENTEREDLCISFISHSCVQDVAKEKLLPREAEPKQEACYIAEGEAWDHILNERYRERLAFGSELDADRKGEGVFDDGSEDRRSVDTLKKAERAWIAFRDAEVERVQQDTGHGTLRNVFASKVRARLTAERALTLNWEDCCRP